MSQNIPLTCTYQAPGGMKRLLATSDEIRSPSWKCHFPFRMESTL